MLNHVTGYADDIFKVGRLLDQGSEIQIRGDGIKGGTWPLSGHFEMSAVEATTGLCKNKRKKKLIRSEIENGKV